MSYTSVVRIFATRQRPDYDNPWQSRTPSRATGSGVVIGPGGQILTGAHVIADTTFVQIQKVADPTKYIARVTAVCHDADLALLEVDEPRFMDGVQPEQLGELPDLRDRVSVVGYPVGGEEISITEGVVSRIEVQRYSHSRRRLLAVTVDAAINNGNSGGPVLRAGQVVGIAFQTLKDAESIGEMVPVSLIKHFLDTVRGQQPPPNGSPVVMHLPSLGLKIQTLENPLLHSRTGMSPQDTGVLVRAVEHGSSAWSVLQEGDALLALDGYSVANNGTVQYLNRYRTSCSVVLDRKNVGDELAVTILRHGRRTDLTLELRPNQSLVPQSQYDTAPVFKIYGGLVFQVLSLDFLRTWKDWWENAPAEFLHYFYSGLKTEERQEIVILSQILADEINVGYEGFHNESVVSVNGRRPRHMKELAGLIDSTADLVEIKLSSDRIAVFDPAMARQANERILKRYHIPALCSPSLAGA